MDPEIYPTIVVSIAILAGGAWIALRKAGTEPTMSEQSAFATKVDGNSPTEQAKMAVDEVLAKVPSEKTDLKYIIEKRRRFPKHG